MTEKRFTLAYEKGNWWVVKDGDITLWKEEVIHLLNELHEENQQLLACKEFCNSLKKENEALKSSNMEMEDYLARIEEENRELEKFRYLVFQKMEELHE